MADDNKLLGQFDLVGIPPAPRGSPQIEVTFDIDANGIVKVSAQDKATGKEQQVTIQSSGGLSEAEVEKMVRDAKSHEENDKKRKKLAEVRNRGEMLVNTYQKSLEEHRSKVPQEDIDLIETEMRNVKEAIENKNITDPEEIERKIKKLEEAVQKMGQAINKAQGQGGQGQGGQGQGGQGQEGSQSGGNENTKKGDTQDAEFEENPKK